MDFYILIFSFAVTCKFSSYAETRVQIKNVSNYLPCVTNNSFPITNNGLCNSNARFELLSLIELSSNSLPIHIRVPRNIHNKNFRRHKYRHSTRVYTEKPAHFLLPPKDSIAIRRGNYLTTQPVESSTRNIIENSGSSTTPSIQQIQLPIEIKSPSIILEPPQFENQPNLKIVKHRSYNHKLRYRGHKLYDRRYTFRATTQVNAPKKNVDNHATNFSSTILSVRTFPTTDFVSSPKSYETTEAYNDSNLLLHPSDQDMPSFHEKFDFLLTTSYPETVKDNTLQSDIVYFNTMTPKTDLNEKNITMFNKSNEDDIISNLLSPEVASMGMKVVATKKGIYMVRRTWFEVDSTTMRLEIKNQDNIDESNGNLQLSVAETGDYRTKLLDDYRQHTESQSSVDHVIPGIAGVDYPTLTYPPVAKNKPCSSGVGYFADTSSGCQVFYICIGNGVGEPLLCPNGTLFSQDFLVCDWWYNVDCH